jgi:sugar lactone lactonase YvrE
MSNKSGQLFHSFLAVLILLIFFLLVPLGSHADTAVVVSDSFSRTVSNGWGSADTGGSYSLTGTAANFSTNGSVGIMHVTGNGSSNQLIARLNSVSARDVDETTKISLDKLPTGTAHTIYIIGRTVSDGNEYRLKLYIGSNGDVKLQASTIVSGNETLLGNQSSALINITANQTFDVHTQFTGVSPTSINARIWLDSNSEPTTWGWQTTDSTSVLQAAGSVGLLSRAGSGAPVNFSYDNFTVTSGTPSPTPTPVIPAPTRGVSGDKWADIILGQPDFTGGTRNETTAFKLNNPGGTLMDRGTHPNTLYVSDSANSRILVYNSLGVCHNNATLACTTNADCSNSTCDLNTSKNADVVIGQPDFTRSACNGDFGYLTYPNFPAPSASTLCGMPPQQISPLEGGYFASFAVDSGHRLYFPDWVNNRVVMYSNPTGGGNGQSASHIWGQASSGDYRCNRGQSSPSNNTLCFSIFGSDGNALSSGVDVDSAGNLWVADSDNHRVLRFPYNSTTGQPDDTANLVLGQSTMSSNDSGSGLNQMLYPTAVRVDTSGKVYVADTGNNRILLFQGTLSNGMNGTVWGSGFNEPTGIEFDVVISGDSNTGGIWINDTNNHMIELWNTAGTAVRKVLYSDTYPATHGSDSVCNSPINVCYQDDSRGSVAISSNDDLFVASSDGNQDVVRFPYPISTPQSNVLVPADYELYPIQRGMHNYISGKGLLGPYGVAVYDNGSTHQLIVSDSNRILYWNNPLSAANGQIADGVVGAADFHTENHGYGRLQVDKSGHLYVPYNNTVQIYQLPLSGGQQPLTTFAAGSLKDLEGANVNLPIQGDLVGGDGLYPTADGNFLWITDAAGSRVVRVRNPGSTNPVVDVVIGQSSVSGTNCNQGGAKALNTLCNPGAVVLDSNNKVYISDDALEETGNGRLLEYDPSNFPTNNTSTIFNVSANNVIMNGPMVFQPGFDSHNQMVIGYNSYSYSNTNHSLEFFTSVAANAVPSGEFNDYFDMPYSVTFDASDNMYVSDIDKSKVMIYKNPLSDTSSQILLSTTSHRDGNLWCSVHGPQAIKDTDTVTGWNQCLTWCDTQMNSTNLPLCEWDGSSDSCWINHAPGYMSDIYPGNVHNCTWESGTPPYGAWWTGFESGTTPTPTASPTPTSTPTPTPTPTPIVSDTFSRTVSNGWGTADTGGSYTLGGTAANFSTNGSVGLMHVTGNGSTYQLTARLDGVSIQNTDETVKISVDKLPTGTAHYIYIIGRHISTGNEYRMRISIGSNGDVKLQGETIIGGTETMLGSQSTALINITANQAFDIRAQFTGSAPTSLSAKVWLDTNSEPSGWGWQTTDSTSVLQAAGSVGLISRAGSAAPIYFSFDNFTVK